MFNLPKWTYSRSEYNSRFPFDVLFLMIASVFCAACSADVSQNSTPETRPIECNPERDNCDGLPGLRDASMIRLDAGPPNDPTPDSDSNANGDEARNGPREAPTDPLRSPSESIARISIGELSTEPVMTSAGPLNTSTLQSPNGLKARYLRDEILLVTRPDDSLEILEEYQLTHLETLNLGRDKVLHRLHTATPARSRS